MLYVLMRSLGCRKCVERNITIKCRHRFNTIPPWKTVLRILMIRREHRNNPEKFITELLGEPSNDSVTWFTKSDVLSFVRAERMPLSMLGVPLDRRIYIGIDPTGNSFSRFGVVSLAYFSHGPTVSFKKYIYTHMATIGVCRAASVWISSRWASERQRVKRLLSGCDEKDKE